MNRGPRKNIRLSGYNYRRIGAYFVTICTTERAPMFWRDFLCPKLSASGMIVKEEINALEVRFPSVRIEKKVIMPDHVHILLTLKRRSEEERQGQSPCPTRGTSLSNGLGSPQYTAISSENPPRPGQCVHNTGTARFSHPAPPFPC